MAQVPLDSLIIVFRSLRFISSWSMNIISSLVVADGTALRTGTGGSSETRSQT
jgi:hypothetical protein